MGTYLERIVARLEAGALHIGSAAGGMMPAAPAWSAPGPSPAPPDPFLELMADESGDPPLAAAQQPTILASPLQSTITPTPRSHDEAPSAGAPGGTPAFARETSPGNAGMPPAPPLLAPMPLPPELQTIVRAVPTPAPAVPAAPHAPHAPALIAPALPPRPLPQPIPPHSAVPDATVTAQPITKDDGAPAVRLVPEPAPAQALNLAELMAALYPAQREPLPAPLLPPAASVAPALPSSEPVQVTIGEIRVEILPAPPAEQIPAPAVARPPLRPGPRHGVRSKQWYGIGQR